MWLDAGDVSFKVDPTKVTPHDLPPSDGRKLKGTILAVAAVALLFLTVIGGIALGLVLAFAKSDGEKKH